MSKIHQFMISVMFGQAVVINSLICAALLHYIESHP